ncbi:MAG TPA: hypothetical protein PKZ84_04535 [Anaerolineae bacterium]|nr:hypothetical protein [Anaerolineae bacterium]HQI83835.1 hypothetical protein [Anaerolineae bacterium]
MRYFSRYIRPEIFFIVLVIVVITQTVTVDANVQNVTLSLFAVPEGRDFATWVLTDPWDMQQFSDISMYLNESNVAIHLQDIQVADGIFSARSADTDAQFFTLFPGYQSAINAGKVGSRYPVNSSVYHCLYMRMKVDSDLSYDEMRVWWVADNHLFVDTYGVTTGIPLSRSEWAIYSMDLATMSDSVWSPLAWLERPAWQGLRIDPTIKTGVNFQVDWVRLTDCTPVNTTVSWTPTAGSVEIWAGIGQAAPDFKVATSLSGETGTYTLDVQGWEPGYYYIGVKDATGFSWTEQPLWIDPVPQVKFARPAFNSGETLRWEMNSAAELTGTRCVQAAFGNGVLDLLTLPPAMLPPICAVGGISDPQLDLALPVSLVDTSLFRYLTIHINTEGLWQDVNHGWMMRWLWRTYENGNPDQACYNVSNDIPFDVGWDTLTIDLHDAFEGLTEDYAGGAFCHPRDWSDDPTDYLRLDPNENTLPSSMHQQLDWVRLSRMDRVAQGTLFPIRLKLSEDAATMVFDLYYTSDLSTPRQHAVVIAQGTSGTPSPLPYHIYLPLVQQNWIATEISFMWDTTAVPVGEYYICSEINDGVNVIVSCSEAPVEVYITR